MSEKSSTKLRSLNLNHLPILREVLRLESVTKAADALHLSQPAVSNILKALRGYFDDELIARDGTAMRRTQKGQELLALLETSLSRVETAVEGRSFDPKTATGPLRIAAVDNLVGLAAGPMCQVLAEEAPELRVQFVGATRSLAEDLKSGAVELAVTSTEFINSAAIPDSLRDEIHTLPIATESLVCIARDDDEAFASGLSLEDYLARSHASYTVDPDHPYTIERKRIREAGVNRTTRASTTSNQSLPEIVAASDCLAIVPISMAITASKLLPLQYRKPPIDLPDIEWIVAWHERSSANDLVQWAKDRVVECSLILTSRIDGEIRANSTAVPPT